MGDLLRRARSSRGREPGGVVSRGEGWSNRATLMLVTTVLAMMAPALAIGVAGPVAAKEGRATEETPLQAEPTDGAPTLILIPADTTLTIGGRATDGYYPVAYGGVEGWVATGSLATRANEGEAERQSTGPTVDGSPRSAVTEEDLNFRDGPGQDTGVLAVIPAGDAVVLTGQQEAGYLQVRYEDAEGWARGEYLVAAVPESREPSEYTETEIVGFIEEAAAEYDQPVEDMLRVARCESDLVPRAVNSRGGSYGIFQFKTGTWLSTPYADYDIFDPRASAMAAGWMWSQGRRNEWVCQ